MLKPPPRKGTAALPVERQSGSEWRPQTYAPSCRPVANNSQEEEPYFGDIPGPLGEHYFRLGCLNVNRISPYKDPSLYQRSVSRSPLEDTREIKHEEIFHLVQKMSLSITLMQEIGVNWSCVPRQHQWRERAAEVLDRNHTKSFLSHNCRDVSGNLMQWGGTGVMSFGKLSHYASGGGSDKAKLGRWTWARFVGRNGTMLRCVSIYRPNASQGAMTVASQHRRYFQTVNDNRDPRSAFVEDFEQELCEGLEAGDHVIVGGGHE